MFNYPEAAAAWAAYLAEPHTPAANIFCTRCQVGSNELTCFICLQPYDRTYSSHPTSAGWNSASASDADYPGPGTRDMLQADPGPLPEHFHDVYNGRTVDTPPLQTPEEHHAPV